MPALSDDTARKVLKRGYHDMGESVEYRDLLLMKVGENREGGAVVDETYALVDEETGEDTGERIETEHYAITEYDELREDLRAVAEEG